MPVKIITIDFNPETGLFQEEDLTRWLINKRVISQTPAFFKMAGKAYWSVFVEYDVPLAPEERREPTITLPAKTSALLDHLRVWRREKAEKEGVPAFVIATNIHLEQVVQRLPTTLEGLRQINGFGAKKADRHGRDIIELVKAFVAKEPPPLPATPAAPTDVTPATQATEAASSTPSQDPAQ